MDDRVVISKFFDGWVWDRYDGNGTQIAISYGSLHGTRDDAVTAAVRCNAQPYILEIKDLDATQTVLDPSSGTTLPPIDAEDPDRERLSP